MSDSMITADGITGISSTDPTPSATNWSMIAFVVLTFVFFYLKYYNNVTLFKTMNDNGTPSLEGFTHSLSYFLIYFMLVFIAQLTECSVNLNSKCSNNESRNFGFAVLYCIGPWIFIFLVMVFLLVYFPLVKKAFSDVIGYLFVSRSMNVIFSELLYSSEDVKKKIAAVPTDKEKYELASEAIMKIVNNKSVFVNQLEPQNFLKNWNILEPLMKPNTEDLKEKLYRQVIKRDIIGEFCWYIYTGLFVCSIVSYNVSVKGCKKSVAQLQKEFSTDVPPPNSGGPNVFYNTYDSTL